MRLRWIFVGLAAMSCLTGCGGAPSASPPTVVNLTIEATPDNNLTVDNKGAPLAIRVYQLAGAAGFNAAEFFPLYNDDDATLKTDLVHRDDFLLAPGASKSETIMPKDNVASIGVFGAYRGFQTAVWRVSFDVVPHKTIKVTVTAGHDGLVLKTDATGPK
ncbi:MAG TPA: type VI secretion system lipoprotein TssJ [Acetobacteraceae bacterium]|jgi:type VI secretion system protein VasD|nr:type VI secretion system lipoprotein TssJ [Acetobacteraceae bacterium]